MSLSMLLKVGLTLVVPGILIALGALRGGAHAAPFTAAATVTMVLGTIVSCWAAVADDAKLYELRLKGDAAGKTYLGFEAPPGDPQDREILSSTDRLMTMRFVDPDSNRRYGTFVYVRCGA